VYDYKTLTVQREVDHFTNTFLSLWTSEGTLNYNFETYTFMI